MVVVVVVVVAPPTRATPPSPTPSTIMHHPGTSQLLQQPATHVLPVHQVGPFQALVG
jgi:hypothetical protein